MDATERKSTTKHQSTLIYYFQPWREESSVFIAWMAGRKGFGWLNRQEYDLDRFYQFREKWKPLALWWWSASAGGGDLRPKAKQQFEQMLMSLTTEGWQELSRKETKYRIVARLKRK